MNPSYALIAERAEFRCEYCHAPAALFNFPFEIEHIVPTARGGTDDPDNLALSCRACNVFKGTSTTGIDPASNLEAALFHPRRDEWLAHFQFDRDKAELIGTTPIGRATIEKLRFNHPMQVRARREWIRLGQYS